MSNVLPQDDPPAPIVYVHIGTLCGVIKSHYHPSTSQNIVACASVLGKCAVAYLAAHGYTLASVDTIIHIYHSTLHPQFALQLAVHGMSLSEATYLHELMDQ